ncbi:MAG: hypothetical protein IT205_08965 [Fimbriimonadaceae bacterium]|nr:hypothetical protein [Fimbriimonadaceae bacterium]
MASLVVAKVMAAEVVDQIPVALVVLVAARVPEADLAQVEDQEVPAHRRARAEAQVQREAQLVAIATMAEEAEAGHNRLRLAHGEIRERL